MKTKLHSFLLLVVLLFAASCKKVDLYKETNKESSSLFSDGVGVPSGFNWSSVKTVDIRIAVDDQFNGQYFYKVEVFDGDPVFGSGAKLLGAGQAKQNQDYAGKIVVPTALEYIYIKKTSPEGIVSVSMLSVKDVTTVTVAKSAAVSVNAVASVNKTGANTWGLVSGLSATNLLASTSGASSTSTATAVTVPAGAIEISGSGQVDFNPNTNYIITAGTVFTGTINTLNAHGSSFFIEGKWINNNAGFEIKSEGKLYVLSSGELDVHEVKQHGGGKFLNYGKSVLSKMTVSNDALFENYNDLKVGVKGLLEGNGDFTNHSGAKAVFKYFESTSGGSVVTNDGKLTVETLLFTGGQFYANCYTSVDLMHISGATFTIASGALLSVGDIYPITVNNSTLNIDNSTFNLASSSTLDISGTAKFNWNNKINGPLNGSQALARFGKIESNWGGVEFKNYVAVACSDHASDPNYFKVTHPATYGPYDQAIAIASTACNGGGTEDPGSGTTPGDQTVTEVNLGTYSYAFEDNWPSFGDYDMNDFVTDMTIKKYQNSANKVTKLQLTAKLRSVGASKRLAAAVQLDGVPTGNIKSVSYSREDLIGQALPLASNNVESGQTYAVVPICDDAHKAFGISGLQFISTKNGAFSPVDVVITIEFNTPLDDFTYQDLNTFLITDGYKHTTRNEIHMIGYKATDKINGGLVTYQTEKVGQLSVGDPFRSHDGYPWALCIPVSFDYPVEGQKITAKYLYFSEWALSGGVESKDWYIK